MCKELIHVLLVDDDIGDRRLMEQVLRQRGGGAEFVVSSAWSLAECLESLRTGEYDLILLDLGLPDSVGLETVDRVCRAC